MTDGQPHAPWYRALSFNGFVSTSYSHNFNEPLSRTNQFRVFDVADRSFRLDAAELVVQKTVSNRGDLGFRLDAMAGAGIPPVVASAGLFRDRAGNAHDYDVHQAYVSYIAPVGRGLRLDAGKFVTHAGYEVIEGYDAYNDNFTHSFLFGYAIPFTHAGVKATYGFSEHVSGMLLVTNGCDVARDNNNAVSLGAQMSVALHARVNLLVNYIGGPERADNDTDARRVYDIVATWKVSDRLNTAFNGTYGTEANVPLPAGARDVTWAAMAGYARYNVTPAFGVAVRAERFDDGDGAKTGVVQRLYSVTVTPEIKPANHLVLRTDVRLDRSNMDAFETRTAPVRHQATIGLNAICVF